MTDLKHPGLLWTKAALLLVIGVGAAALVLVQRPTLSTALLLAVCIWAFCRAYYFVFYVLEHYVDPGYRFSGLVALAAHLVRRTFSTKETP